MENGELRMENEGAIRTVCPNCPFLLFTLSPFLLLNYLLQPVHSRFNARCVMNCKQQLLVDLFHLYFRMVLLHELQYLVKEFRLVERRTAVGNKVTIELSFFHFIYFLNLLLKSFLL